MSDGEPAVLRGERGAAIEPPPAAARPASSGSQGSSGASGSSGSAASSGGPAPSRGLAPATRSARDANAVYVVGFWKRAAAAIIDLAIVIPAALLITIVVSKLAGIHLPRLQLVDVDLWIDLVLATDPALVMGLVLTIAIGMVYLLVFQIVLGRTLGMRVLKIKIIDVFGDPPSPGRCLARCGGYLASVATLFLGFLWIGFDSEKRGLQDWIAGTLVIRA
jgi:uncharacterized RDD family membrane protein YckC